MTISNGRWPLRVAAGSVLTLFRKKTAAALAVALSGALSPAVAAESETTLYKSAVLAPKVQTACQPGGVLVGVKGYQSYWIYSMQPVCVNTQGGRWTSATYTGASQGMNLGSAYSSVCPANTVVKSLSGRLLSWLGQIQLTCQALNDAGAYAGPVTTLDPVGGYTLGTAQTATCVAEQAPKGLIGTYLSLFAGFGMSCGTRAEGLKGVSIPTPSNLYDFVANKDAAVALGKMLFWDRQVGSDSVQACASCHFHAGADSRSKNQLSPGLARASSPTVANPDNTFQLGGPNYQLTTADYPFHQRSNPDDYYSPVVRNLNDVTASQGVFNSVFNSAGVGQYYDNTSWKPDPVFNVGGNPTRRVEPRNTPTTINAVFNFRNFWDGRAQYLFNGVNPFGARDDNARVFKNVGGAVQPAQVRIDNASLASQAVGPPSSNFEMSADGRTLMDIAKRLLEARPLALQRIAPDDSVLGAIAGGVTGLNNGMTYADIVRTAFKPEWWSGTQAVQVDASGGKTVIAMPGALAKNQYTQMQANFSLFFGLAVQLYEATLVSDDSPYDRYMAGESGALSPDQKTGMSLFFGKGKCANCHGGAEFTNASVRKTLNEPLQRMVMGNGGVAVYDEGFYNTAVTPTLEDILNGGRDAFGKPLSNTAIAQQYGSAGFQQMIGISPNLTVSPTERIAVMGASKTSTVRNIELMNPHFHNGGALNLKHVMEFYNRGGNFKQANINDVDPDITPLGLSATEKNQIIAFMKSLTDDRVRRDAAPFDHPELQIPNGHPGNQASVTVDGAHAKDELVTIPAIGRGGAAGLATPNFLGVVE